MLCGDMVSVEDFQISSPGPMIGFSFGEQTFKNGCSSGMMFTEVSAADIKAFWKACGRNGKDWLEFRRHLDDQTTDVMMNEQLGELFPVWYCGRSIAKTHPVSRNWFSQLRRESWDLTVGEEVIRLHYEREYEPISQEAGELETSIKAENRLRWIWAEVREWVRIAIEWTKILIASIGG